MADYDRAIELNPEDAAAHYKRGTVLALSDQHDHAIESFDRAINLDPSRSQWYNARGISKGEVISPVAALDDYDSAIDLNPKNADAYYNRAIANARLGNVEDSNANLERAIALGDGYKDAYLERGNVTPNRATTRKQSTTSSVRPSANRMIRLRGSTQETRTKHWKTTRQRLKRTIMPSKRHLLFPTMGVGFMNPSRRCSLIVTTWQATSAINSSMPYSRCSRTTTGRGYR